MRIRRANKQDEPEINLIPLIDVLLVIVIFLVVSSTFVRTSQLKVELPGTQNAQKNEHKEERLEIKVGRDGNYSFDSKAVLDEQALRLALKQKLSEKPVNENTKAMIQADAAATHQSVVTVMDILASLGVAKVSIATARK